jgi:hypothetical protein
MVSIVRRCFHSMMMNVLIFNPFSNINLNCWCSYNKFKISVVKLQRSSLWITISYNCKNSFWTNLKEKRITAALKMMDLQRNPMTFIIIKSRMIHKKKLWVLIFLKTYKIEKILIYQKMRIQLWIFKILKIDI